MSIDVLVEGERVPVERRTFSDLLENSVVNARKPLRAALETGEITLSALINLARQAEVNLARQAEVPYALFFAPAAVVQAQLRAKTEKLLQGMSAETFTVNSRSTVALRDVELIVKDLLRKQALLRTHDTTLVRNPVMGLLRKPHSTVEQDASALLDVLELDRREVWSATKSADALERIIAKLEAKQVLVSRSQPGYMPQLVKVHFSGMTVRDTKVPYIFLAGGDHEDFQEPIGRQLFTLILMTVLVARGIFAPVTYDAQSIAPDPGREYDIVGEFLMPADEVKSADLGSLEGVKAAARRFKVTPSAMAVRSMRVGELSGETVAGYLADLKAEYQQQAKGRGGPPNRFNAIRKYGSRELVVRMLRAVESGSLAPREFCRVVSLNRLKTSQIDEFRRAL